MNSKERADMRIMWRTGCLVNGFVNPDYLKTMRRREQKAQGLKKPENKKSHNNEARSIAKSSSSAELFYFTTQIYLIYPHIT